jgi:DNA-binding response OmpR family regulator
MDLKGRSILIVEDEPLIALDIGQAFAAAGAEITTTSTVRQATVLVEHDGLSAAVLDHALGDGDSDKLCERLTQRSIPFVIYSGFGNIDGHCKNAPHVHKPTSPHALVKIIVELLQRAPPN